MGIKRKTTEESGLTLVEILASLVILGIVFVAFMTIFPQMTLFNSRTETKLETMNEARIVLEEYKGKTVPQSTLGSTACPNENWTQLEYLGNQTFKKNRNVLVKVKDCPDIKPADKSLEGVAQLNRIHIEIRIKGRIVSESFGYVKVK